MNIGADGWLDAARRYPSPNFNARPAGSDVELLVVHNISLPAGQFGGPHIADLFTNRIDLHADPSFADLRGVTVSAHFLIRRDGGLIQFVSCDARAWHAGVSVFDGRENCNDFSIGVELEGADHVAFSPAQYASLAALTLAILARYPLTAVQGHEHIAPGRKTDPGPFFDWPAYADAVEKAAAKAAAKTPQNGAALAPANRAVRFVNALKKVKIARAKTL